MLCMQALFAVYGQLDIENNPALASLQSSFNALSTIEGYLLLSSNGFTSLNDAFPVSAAPLAVWTVGTARAHQGRNHDLCLCPAQSLAVVDDSITISDHPSLQTINNAFQVRHGPGAAQQAGSESLDVLPAFAHPAHDEADVAGRRRCSRWSAWSSATTRS